MYQINILKNNEWQYFDSCNTKYELDIRVSHLTYLRPNKPLQVLEDEKELVVLDGSEYQYFYFKKRYIDNENLDYNYIKEYQKTRKN